MSISTSGIEGKHEPTFNFPWKEMQIENKTLEKFGEKKKWESEHLGFRNKTKGNS